MERWVSLSLVALMGCAPKGNSVDTCTEPPPTTPRCCDSSYTVATISDVLSNPGTYVYTHVEVTGAAEWYQDPRQGADCICAGDACGCIVPLGVMSTTCNVILPLSGDYRGRPVQCASDGCWPLTILQSYAVCGTLQPGDPTQFGSLPVLAVDTFCGL